MINYRELWRGIPLLAAGCPTVPQDEEPWKLEFTGGVIDLNYFTYSLGDTLDCSKVELEC